MTPTRLLREMSRPSIKVLIIVMMCLYDTGGIDSCIKCYHPLYDGENLESLVRVHTNLSPSCYNQSQLETCQEGGKVYRITRNTASFRQRLLGECPMNDNWLCFERKDIMKGEIDIVKEKKVNMKTSNKEWEDLGGKNLFIDSIEKISKELNITRCWACGNTQMSDVWPWEGVSLKPREIL